MLGQQADGIIMIDREGKGHISLGYAFQPDMISELFDVSE